jgi:ATP-dependent Lhr-like helicase
VIIDEVHHFMESPRGVQLICILERIQRLSKCSPRRIGLSATLSDTASAERWLNAGSGRECVTPKVSGGSRVVALRMKRFICSEQLSDEELEDLNDNDEADATRTSAEVFKSATVDHCRYLYSQTRNKKAIIFARSRAEVEDLISGVKRVAEMEKSKDIYYTHHSSISAALREEAEAAMKNSDEPTVIGATLTLELGIDIGALDRVIQVGAPISVSSFTQRVGRCGRKGQRSELIFTFVEKPPKAFEELDTINWEFVKCVAVIELYLRDRWVEPAFAPSFPYGILYHQTMCHLASVGEATAPSLAQNVLSLSAFSHVPLEDYRELLSNMLEIGHIVRSERGFMVGKDAESKVAFYEFLCVFENSVEYTVKHDVKTIGTITGLLPVGVRFALAGRTWEVVTIAEKGKTIFVKPAAGRRRTNWVSSYSGTVHPVLVQKMKTILSSDEKYGYLSPDCQERLDEIRNICNEKGILDHPIAKVGKRNFCVFPWIGSQSLSTLLLALQDRGVFCTIKPTPSNPIYLETTVSRESYEFEYDSDVDSMIKRTLEVLGEKIDRHDVILPAEIQTPGKFNKFIPKELLAKQFVEDFLTDVEPCL